MYDSRGLQVTWRRNYVSHVKVANNVATRCDTTDDQTMIMLVMRHYYAITIVSGGRGNDAI